MSSNINLPPNRLCSYQQQYRMRPSARGPHRDALLPVGHMSPQARQRVHAQIPCNGILQERQRAAVGQATLAGGSAAHPHRGCHCSAVHRPAPEGCRGGENASSGSKKALTNVRALRSSPWWTHLELSAWLRRRRSRWSFKPSAPRSKEVPLGETALESPAKSRSSLEVPPGLDAGCRPDGPAIIGASCEQS